MLYTRGVLCIIGVATVFAFRPTYIVITALIKNDGLAILFDVVGMGVLLSTLHDSRLEIKSGILIGVLFGLAIVTKINAVILLFSVPVADVFSTDQPLSSRIMWIVACLVPVMMIAGPWILLNMYRYGNPSGGFHVLFDPDPPKIDLKFIRWAIVEFLLSF